MQNIQDLQEKIFLDTKNMISILYKINHVDELLSRQDLIDELADRISFLKLLKTKVKYYQDENSQASETLKASSADLFSDSQHFSDNVTEEEAIFNNELNEIGSNENISNTILEEEAIFNNQLNEIVENEFHESMINLAAEKAEGSGILAEENAEVKITEDNPVLNDVFDEDEEQETPDPVLSFVDEEKILENSEPEDIDVFDEEIFDQKVTEEEAIFNNQLNEIDDNENSDHQNVNSPEETHNNPEAETQIEENSAENTTTVFESESTEDTILIEESVNQYVSDVNHGQDEIVTESSNVESILAEIKKDVNTESEEKSEESDRRKIVDIDKPTPEAEKDKPASDESFENLEAYQQEKKIRLANIKGLKTIQTLFDDDPLAREIPQEKPAPVTKEDSGSILKTNIPTGYMEAEKQRPEFKLDLNDRIAFTKVLFGGSQTDLNNAVSELNRCKNLEEAKEYLSDLYYDKKWNKVDEYAQRLWILVENKFL